MESAHQDQQERAQPSDPAAAPDRGLSEYRRRKLALGELIHGAINLASERHDDYVEEGAREVLARLAEDRFQLAVVGQFSRGKSTLMNAILGSAYLPTGALPMTSVITHVSYGSRPRVTVRRRSGHLPIETSLEDLVRFVAQSSAEREELQVASAEVQLPVEILRLGFSFIDTPGIGSAVAANTAITKRFLPEADAVIFVTSFDAPLSGSELEFLAEIRRHIAEVFLVVNKLDLVTEREADEIVGFVHARLAEQPGGAPPRVFSLSARRALEAKTTASSVDLAEGGLRELEQSLLQLLTTEKARSLLHRICDRADGLLTRQRLELELGRPGAWHEDPFAAFDARVRDLIARQQRIGERLVRRVDTALPRALAERSGTWTDELTGLVLAESDASRWETSSAGKARDWTAELAEALEGAVPRLLDRWLTRVIGETRSLLMTLGAEELAELHSTKESVEQLAAEAFRARLDPATIDVSWSQVDLPQLAIEDVAFSVSVDSPRRRWRMSQAKLHTDSHARLLQAVDAALVAYRDELQAALVRAARRWVESVAAAVQRDTRDAADRLQASARNPGNAEQLATLDRLERELTAFRAETAASDLHGPALEPVSAPPTSSWEPSTGCVICERVSHVPFEYMAHAQWELARRDARRAAHARCGGFCPMHTWQYAEIASDVGVAVAYSPLARSAATVIDSVDDEPDRDVVTRSLLELTPGPKRCPACIAIAEAERDAVRELIADLPARPDGRAAPSLCLKHLADVLAADRRGGRAQWLARKLADTLRRGADDMQTYALKRESRRGYLLSDEEDAAGIHVISYLAGRRQLVFPWRRSDEIG